MILGEPLERYARAIWYGGRPPPGSLRAMAAIHERLRPVRRPTARPPVPLIVVGNLCVGGSGKTPVVIELARRLRTQGRRVAVLSRGYGGTGARQAQAVDADSDPRVVGDEPVLIARASGAPVWVARQRARALAAALEVDGPEVVIADDGLQHRALPRSLELCVFDGRFGIGNGLLLPAGPLRQSIKRLDHVDLVLVKGQGWTRTDAVGFDLESQGFYRLGQNIAPGRERPVGTVDAVAGIAHPEAFAAQLEGHGLNVRLHPRRDHHVYRAGELDRLAGPIVVTAKDAVKLERCPPAVETWVLRVRACLPETFWVVIDRHLEAFGHGQ